MTTATRPKPILAPSGESSREPSAAGGSVVLRHASWELYEQLVREVVRPTVRITYDRGTLTLMSPLPIHDLVKTIVARLIELTVVELNIPCIALGSTTWKRHDLLKGLEADESYYVQHEADARFDLELDLRKVPPPDLALEIVITNDPAGREAIYAALGVPEVWKFDGESMQMRHLEDGVYEPIHRSVAIPMLTPALLDEWIVKAATTPHTELFRQFQAWLRTLPEARPARP